MMELMGIVLDKIYGKEGAEDIINDIDSAPSDIHLINAFKRAVDFLRDIGDESGAKAIEDKLI